MATGPKILYEFGPFRLDPEKQILYCKNQPVPVTPKALETLLILVRRSREDVSKDDLMKALWPDSFVEEANLSQNIFVLRKALGDTPEDRRYIVTLPGRGYRFAAEVRTVTEGASDLVIEGRSRSRMVIEQTGTVSGETFRVVAASVSRASWKYVLPAGAAVVLLVLGAVSLLLRRPAVAIGEKDSVLIADFANSTGDPVFDDTLRQGLAVQLEQSPYLSLVSPERIRQTLRLMNQPPDARLSPQLARDVCQRTGGAAVLEGSIASLGSQYVLGLRAVNCRTGDLLDEEQTQAPGKEDVLNALSRMATKFRGRIGESLSAIREHDVPLSDATTPSLDALKAYSLGRRVLFSTGSAAAVPLFERAIELDPKFAVAHAWLGRVYGDLGEFDLSAASTGKAYELRDRASDRERFFITASYELQVTGNLEKAQQASEAWARVYPREMIPHAFLSGIVYPVLGQYERSVEEGKKVIQLDPDFANGYDILAYGYEYLGRLEDAEATLRRASERKLEVPEYIVHRYDLAFLKGEKAAMDREVALAAADPEASYLIAHHEAFVSAYTGHLQQAIRLAQRAADLAAHAGQPERGAQFEAGEALCEAFFGRTSEARRTALAAMESSKERDAEYGASLALALAGDSARAEALTSDLEKRFPEDTSVRYSYLPTLRAVTALRRGEPRVAVEQLQPAVSYELGAPRSSMHGFFGALYPVYVRGEAYLALRQGAEAAREFQKILDHPGIVVSDPVGALGRLGLARAYALSGEAAKARSAYQNFLGLFKDADSDLPVLREAKSEFARLH